MARYVQFWICKTRQQYRKLVIHCWYGFHFYQVSEIFLIHRNYQSIFVYISEFPYWQTGKTFLLFSIFRLHSHWSIYAKNFRLYLRNQREFYPGSVGQGKAEESAFLPRKSIHPFSFSLVFTDQRIPLGAMVPGASRTSNPLSRSAKQGEGSIPLPPK